MPFVGMARSIRIEYSGAYYHVMARGNRRGLIFLDDDDRRFFLRALGQACQRTGWRVLAWVLMDNHYHLFIQTPEANLSVGMKWLQNTYTRRFNVRYRQWGRLFGDRYKAVLVEGGSGYHHQTLLDYIHLNPVRAGLVQVSEGRSVLDYPWSSVAGGYAVTPSKRPAWLEVAHGFGICGLEDSAAGRQAFATRLDRRAAMETGSACGVPALPEEADGRSSHLRHGWFWGTEGFAQKLMGLVEKAKRGVKSRALTGTQEVRAHGAAQAEQWLKEGLAAAGLSEADLPKLRSTDPRKLALTRLLWQQTTVSQGWLADRLHLRSAANVSQLLRRETPTKAERLPKEFRNFLRIAARDAIGRFS